MFMVVQLAAVPVVFGIAAVVAIGGALGGVLAAAFKEASGLWPFGPTAEITAAQISHRQIRDALGGDAEARFSILQVMLRDLGAVRGTMAHPLKQVSTWVVGVVPGAIVSVVVYYLGAYQVFPAPGLPTHP